MWDFLKSHMQVYPNSTISDKQESLSFSDLIGFVEQSNVGMIGSEKCAILCKREINIAKAVLLCMRHNIAALILPYKYGPEACKKVYLSTAFNMVIIDDLINLDMLDGYIQGVYHIETGLVQASMVYETENELDDVAVILSTSGTTGTPKCALITKQNLYTNLNDISEYFNIEYNDKLLICRSLYHCAVLTGEFLISLIKGANIYFYDQGFQPTSIVKEIINNNISVIGGTPTVLYHLCRYILKRRMQVPLKTIVVSGECMTGLTATVIKEALPVCKVYHVYGLTEASPRVSYLPPELFNKNPLSVGYPLKSVKIKVADSDGVSVSNGEEGIIYIKGKNIMKGYYRNMAATDKVLQNDWLCTNDVGFIDNNDLLYIKGRTDDMIIRSGINIYPLEIENLVMKNSLIEDAIAIGVKDDKGGDRIQLSIVTNQNLSLENVYEICKEELPGYLMPDYIEIWDTIPRNYSGKKVRKEDLGND